MGSGKYTSKDLGQHFERSAFSYSGREDAAGRWVDQPPANCDPLQNYCMKMHFVSWFSLALGSLYSITWFIQWGVRYRPRCCKQMAAPAEEDWIVMNRSHLGGRDPTITIGDLQYSGQKWRSLHEGQGKVRQMMRAFRQQKWKASMPMISNPGLIQVHSEIVSESCAVKDRFFRVEHRVGCFNTRFDAALYQRLNNLHPSRLRDQEKYEDVRDFSFADPFLKRELAPLSYSIIFVTGRLLHTVSLEHRGFEPIVKELLVFMGSSIAQRLRQDWLDDQGEPLAGPPCPCAEGECLDCLGSRCGKPWRMRSMQDYPPTSRDYALAHLLALYKMHKPYPEESKYSFLLAYCLLDLGFFAKAQLFYERICQILLEDPGTGEEDSAEELFAEIERRRARGFAHGALVEIFGLDPHLKLNGKLAAVKWEEAESSLFVLETLPELCIVRVSVDNLVEIAQ